MASRRSTGVGGRGEKKQFQPYAASCPCSSQHFPFGPQQLFVWTFLFLVHTTTANSFLFSAKYLCTVAKFR